MAAKPLKKIAIITWEDPATYTGWFNRKRSSKKKPGHVRTVGLLLSEKGKHVRVALDELDHGSKYNGVAVIPKRAIIDMKTYKIEEL